ncbi:calcium spray protein [Truncatella angustata]|uniref:Calcium spray protein n=1 Tax=Truncatella angustata TaxID=152316 RepID=A0A9P8UQY6_9PEZI|nr:calcium spray protein [Truncatella angustata]KAH6657370.1 calcium spray protein [Truncatella angustata]
MRISKVFALPFLGALVASQNVLQSTSLNTCQDNSGFQASKFDVVFDPSDNRVNVNMVATSSIEGNVVFDIAVAAYGYEIMRRVIDPCDNGIAGFCPMQTGDTSTPFILRISPSATRMIPSIAYSFPDLDATVKVYINSTDNVGQSLACLEARISNSKTVDLLGVKWASAAVIGLALLSSAIISGLGHSNAASHIAANAVALCNYFQAQAMIGLTGVSLPPSVQAWTQDFQWSIGIINVGFMQNIFTWYQRATGGTPSQLFSTLETISVQVSKRSLPVLGPAMGLAKRALAMLPGRSTEHVANLAKRTNIKNSSGSYVVTGVQRVAYRSRIESTNLFLTGFTFFCLALAFSALAVVAAKGLCEIATRIGLIKSDKFQDFRNGWRVVLKGVLYRITLLGFPAITILCFWEFTQNDSPAEMVLAVFFLTVALAWAGWKVVQLARRSVNLHKTPAYILFSDPQALNKWGFLYIQFRASAYYFIIPIIGYYLAKGMFIGLGQDAGIAQAIGFIILEAAVLITTSVMRPWMDKKMNSFNITIAVVNFLNAICLLLFTEVFGQPAIVNGIVGVVVWILNAVTTIVLVIFCIITTAFVFFRENPDGRYRFMSDERASFMKSMNSLSAADQLNALASTARGEKGHGLDLDDGENESNSSQSGHRHSMRPSTAGSGPSRSSWRDSRTRVGPSPFATDAHRNSPLNPTSGRNSPTNHLSINPPASTNGHNGPPSPEVRSPNNSSPWQRGAGYDHA